MRAKPDPKSSDDGDRLFRPIVTGEAPGAMWVSKGLGARQAV